MASTGPNSCSTVTTESRNFGSAQNWTNPSNATASDDSRATASMVTWGGTYWIKFRGFGFAIASNQQIDGIVFEVEKSATANSSTDPDDGSVRIVKNSSRVGTDKKVSDVPWPLTDAYSTYGGSTDLWGTTWLYSDVNSANFGLDLYALMPTTTTGNLQIDHVRCTVYHSTSGGGGGSGGAKRVMVMGIGRAILLGAADRRSDLIDGWTQGRD